MRWTLTDDPPATGAPAPPPPAPPAAAPPADAPLPVQPDNPPVPDPGPAASAPADPKAPDPNQPRFHTLTVVEDVWTGDGRIINGNALTWRNLPLPLTATDVISEAHDGAEVVGHYDFIERVGSEIHGYGPWAASTRAAEIRQMVIDHHLQGVSVDLDDIEYEIIFMNQGDNGSGDPLMDSMMPPEQTDADGNVIMPIQDPRQRVTSARIIGGTIVPHPAFQEGQIWDLDTEQGATAAPEPTPAPALVARAAGVQIPMFPPHEWLVDPKLTEPTAPTVTDEGRYFGHLAEWDSCHLGLNPCVPPPHSASNYGWYLHGQVICADGSRASVGQITLEVPGRGHAPKHYSAEETARHYDDLGTAIADVVTGEDEFGIWVAGALRPDASPLQIRKLMAADISGDWRGVGARLELIGVLAVNVGGYHKPRVSVRESGGLVSCLIASLPVRPRIEWQHKAANLIAAGIGRSTADRTKALYASVHGARK